MHAIVVLSGDPPSHVPAAELLIAADGGVDALWDLEVVPDLVIGDMDSADEGALRWAQREGARIERHDPQKDLTDGELAVEAAIAAGAQRIDIYGATGGRTAMLLANLKLLRRCHGRVEARIVGDEEIRLLGPGDAWTDMTGGLDILAVGGDAVVDVEGATWSGRVHLRADEARGVSNRIDGGLRVESGWALVLLT